MSYGSFYRYIYREGDVYWIIKDNERYLECRTLADALYERDRFENVDWNWDKYVQLAETNNNYIHIDLPPYNHESSNISEDKECWVVRGKGGRQKYFGTYYTFEEAEKIARIYNANISHKKKAYRVQKRINGKTVYYGRYKSYEDAEERVKELEANNWSKD